MTEPIATWHRDDAPGAVRLVVEGEIDLQSAETFAHAVYALVREASSPAVLDLSAVTFFGSPGLDILVRANTLADDTGSQLQVIPSRIVRTVINLSGLAGTITTTP